VVWILSQTAVSAANVGRRCDYAVQTTMFRQSIKGATMKELSLLELLHINDTTGYKLVLNLHGGEDKKRFIDQWTMGSLSESDVGFSYWAHFGKSKNGKFRDNFKVGDKCLGFIQMQGEQYLFITAGEIISVPNAEGPCEYSRLQEYDALIGRLIIRTHKGNTYSRYVFSLTNYLKGREIIVQEILPGEYQPVQFKGYENVHFSFPVLLQILCGKKFEEYRNSLARINGIYCLTDTYTGKLYIGSAYGNDGIAQRWDCYIENQTGGNKSLKDLYEEKGEEYFKKYFTFTLLEWLDKKVPANKVIERENYWKEALDTRTHGYNNN